MQYEGGSDPEVSDIVDVPLIGSQPEGHQQETWLLDPQIKWKRAGRLALNHLDAFVEKPEKLRVNGYSSTFGQNNRVPADQARTLQSSLFFLRVHKLTLVVDERLDSWSARYMIDGIFVYGRDVYRLRVTDPVYEYIASPGEYYEIGPCCLTVSLAKSFSDGYCYKLIAAIVEAKGRSGG
ncbi:MAG: hypothetical protein N2038_09295 [Geminicoccaceae bacterium]|nr:hypothetical protein [Geminicoccaceae bacterium]MDW8341046.1 hypothetical protein [Geminicoccaceae bacterium]